MADRRLIEEWLPIAEIGIESLRERTPMTPFPAPNRLHVWFARRPLVASRAAILGSLLPADADRQKFLWTLGIHGDPVKSRVRIAKATAEGERLGKDAYGYSRAFTYTPGAEDLRAAEGATILDPTAGGGSIPFEAVRLECTAISNDLNPVASLILKATVEIPAVLGPRVLKRFTELSQSFRKRVCDQLADLYPDEPEDFICDGYLWARTVTCPYCEGLVPLSPNWRLDGEGAGVRLVPEGRRIRFEIVHKASEHSPGTVKDGVGKCPFPDCGREIDGDDIKRQAQAGRMGHQLYCVVYKKEVVVGKLKNGKPKTKLVRGFRAPRPEDDVDALVEQRLAEKMPLWQARNIVPDEEIPEGLKTMEPMRFGAQKWVDVFNPRQLYGHCTSVEVFQDMVEELKAKNGGQLSELDRAAMVYIALALDKVAYYNAIGCHWDPSTGRVRSYFDRHDFSFKWSYAEMAPTITGLGYDWALEQTGKALGELIELLGHAPETSTNGNLFARPPRRQPEVKILCESADALSLPDASVDCIVMDPPYYDNVMYAELADFFYVWLKRTAGLLYPELFTAHLTDKDREAVANPAKFQGQKGAKRLAHLDYQQRMARIFAEMRRVLKPGGIMTVMFTHKAKDAWDALATGLIEAGFVITASWPVHTEAEGSLHIREKSAAKSTIFLVCRLREDTPARGEQVFWEEVEPKVRNVVREKVRAFQEAGLAGIDLYLACFGPALEIFSRHWPLTRGTARQQPKGYQNDLYGPWDPYRVTPEDALEAARREVKQWRMEQLATVRRQHHLDALTEWYVLAWDAFRAPKFPADEALKLARVVGLDFDQEVKNVACAVSGEDVTLWDSHTRVTKSKLTTGPGAPMLDRLHEAAYTVRFQNTEAARNRLESLRLLDDPTLMTALEALLNVLPPVAPRGKKKPDPTLEGAASDFEALEKLRRLAFAEKVPEPKRPEQIELELDEADAAVD
ncbi:MAG: DNA methylase [Bryobacteraceae bacterium]|nr:MAG: DNA methylase [Bryobacteraceae bacterium]